MSSCTLGFNRAAVSGGSVYLDDVFGAPSLTVRSTIVAEGSLDSGGFENCKGSSPLAMMTTNGYNVDSDGTCGLMSASDQHGNMAMHLASTARRTAAGSVQC